MNAIKLCLAFLLVLSSSAWAADKNKAHPHQGKGTRFNSLPAQSATTADDEAALKNGEHVLKQVRLDDGGRGIAIMDIKASPSRIWEVIADFPSYPGWVDQLEHCAPYKTQGDQVYVEFLLSVYGFDVLYWVHHTFHPSEGWMSWELDYSRENDLDDTTGYWLTYPAPGREGWTRLEYSVDLRLSGWVPGVIENMLAKKGLVLATSWVKQQAEG